MSERKTAPIGYARYANDFYRASSMIDDKMGREKGFEIAAPVPVMYMIGHSIELSLKSYLLYTGTSEDDLRTLYGHNLSKAFEAACNAGLKELATFEQTELEVLNILNQLYKSKELNYIRTGYKKFPPFGPVEALAKKLLVAVSKEVGWRVKL